jgi:hypothetical protein
MAKSVRANIELASERDVAAICKIDAAEVSSRPDNYVKVNLLGAYVLINTWLLMIQQWSRYGWTFVLAYMKKLGLRETIKQFDIAAHQLVDGNPMEFSCARTLWYDINHGTPLTGVPGVDEHTFHSDPLATALLLFRYGKRYSPLQADKLRTASLTNFVAMQKQLKFSERRPTSSFIDERVRDAISRLIPWDSLCDELEKVPIWDIVFTPGVSFDTRADLVSKLKSVAKARVEYFYQPFGIPMVSNMGEEEMQYWGKYSDYEYHTVRIAAVPKNYKTARIIAPEDVVRQAYARRYFIIMDRYTPAMVNLHDQSENQERARLGSIDGSMATIDLSSASDSITKSMLVSYFPDRFVRIMERVLPTHYVYEGKTRQLFSAATMGNSVTFWLESILFTGITVAATECYTRLAGVECDYSLIHVYGDDIIADAHAAPTVMEWLERIGFSVNEDKSYFNLPECDENGDPLPTHYFRESCGEEYYDGTCVSSLYFPRFPLEGTLGGAFSQRYHRDGFTGTRVDTMSSLVDLQHKMFYTCVPASILIAEIVKEAMPKMTTSTPDETLHDIWSYESTPIIVPAPASQCIDGKWKKVVVEGQQREGHYGPVYVVPKLETALSDADRTLVDLYKYGEFLRHGPRYETPLDELLGVSAPPISYGEARLDGEVRWLLIK